MHETYLYNPTYTPTPFVKNITEKFEKDDRVRYFIDLLDPVSVGGLGGMGPKNAVYRSGFKELGPFGTHKLMQWGGATGLHEHDAKPLAEPLKEEEVNQHAAVDSGPADVGVESDFVVDFGDNYNDQAWQVYGTSPTIIRHGLPPLPPGKKKRRQYVMYVDDYWDARMKDVEDMDYKNG